MYVCSAVFSSGSWVSYSLFFIVQFRSIKTVNLIFLFVFFMFLFLPSLFFIVSIVFLCIQFIFVVNFLRFSRFLDNFYTFYSRLSFR